MPAVFCLSPCISHRHSVILLQILSPCADNLSTGGSPLLIQPFLRDGLQWDSFMSTFIETAPHPCPTLNSDYALQHAGGDPRLLIQLCRNFLAELPLRIEQLRSAIAGRDSQLSGRALLQLQNCILIFGAGHASVTAEILENAIRNRRSRQVQREWACLEAQLQQLVPQVQFLILEMVTPTTAVQ